MFTRRDSCSAVAMPMVAARAGSSRRTVAATTSAALSLWVGLRSQPVPSSCAVQRWVTAVVPE